MNITCEHARTLLPGYLDGELSEAHASPLRSHLFDCVGCRESVKQGKNLQRWFHEAELAPTNLPPGFAARVARRALAGDPGLADPPLAPYELQPVAGPGPRTREKPLLPFLLTLSALAAAVLFLFALAIQKTNLPQNSDLQAIQKPSWMLDRGIEPDPAPPEAPVVLDPQEEEEPER